MNAYEDALHRLGQLEGLGNRRKEKIQLLKGTNNHVLQAIFKATYDWRITYGIRVKFHVAGADNVRAAPLFGASANNHGHPWEAFKRLLADLEARELTGNDARAAWEAVFDRASEEERVWFSRILNRDLKVGLDRTSIAEVWPDLIEPFAVQLAKEFDPSDDIIGRGPTKKEPWIGWPVIVEPKLDGMRVIIEYDATTKTAQAFSREGHSLPHIQFLVDEFALNLTGRGFPTCRIDSEAFASVWNETLSLVKKEDVNEADRRAKLRFYCFDCVRADGVSRPLLERLGDLQFIQHNGEMIFRVIEQKTAKNLNELLAVYEDFLDQGHEGVMVKFGGAPYISKRTNAWLKLKPVQTVDAVITGFENGRDGSKHQNILGAFVVRRLDTDETVRVGGGISDAQRKEFWRDRDSLLGQVLEFKEQGARDSVAKVSFPRFVRIRSDR